MSLPRASYLALMPFNLSCEALWIAVANRHNFNNCAFNPGERENDFLLQVSPALYFTTCVM